GANIEVYHWDPRREGRYSSRGNRPSGPLKARQQIVRNETCAWGINMPIPRGFLAISEKAQWNQQMQVVLCPRHRHIKETSLLLNFVGASDGKIRRNAAVYSIQHEN